MNYVIKILRHGLFISCVLFLMGLGLATYNTLSLTNGFSVLTFVDHPGISKNTSGDEILTGQKVKGVIQASENYLGTIELYIDTFNRINDDVIVFRIREKGIEKWYYENIYYTKQITSLQFFPFGFPTIPESKNKLYEYEIESLKGTHGNAIGTNYLNPEIITRYQYPKQSITASGRNLLSFTQIRVKNALQNVDFIIDILIYFLPSLYFFVWFFSKKRYPSLTVILILIIVYDIFFMKSQRGIVFIILIGLWMCHTYVSKFISKIPVLFALALLGLSLTLSLLDQKLLAEKSAVWEYMFLVAAVVSNIFEPKSINNRQTVSLYVFFRTLRNSLLLRVPIYAIAFILWGIVDISTIAINVFFLIHKKSDAFLRRFMIILNTFIDDLRNPDPRTIFNLLTAALRLLLFIVTTLIGIILIIAVAVVLAKTSIQIYMQLDKKIRSENLKRLRLSLDPVIITAEPTIVYHSTKIIFYGIGFDQKADKSSIVKLLAPKHQTEDVVVDYIDNSKIIFTVPLHWNTGQLYFWVETPIIWEGKLIPAKSNVMSIKLIPRISPYSPGFSPDDDAYFKQLEGLREETLRLNGHIR